MFPLHKTESLKRLEHNWVTFWRPALSFSTTPPNRSLFSVSLPSPRFHDLWLYRASTLFLEQPLDEIAFYFGEKVAFYFAWLQLYTQVRRR